MTFKSVGARGIFDTVTRILFGRNASDPVSRLFEVMPLDMPQDWEFSKNPEEDFLGVPSGTVLSLLREIDRQKLWSELVEVGLKVSEQRLLDFSEFFPCEEAFIDPLVKCLLGVKTEHAKVVFAQESADWCWGAQSFSQLPIVIERVAEIAQEVRGGYMRECVPNLERIVENLKKILVSRSPCGHQHPQSLN